MNATVVVLTYNGVDYIREIIEAVFAQDYSDFELLIVDSGSTDGTLEIVAEYPEIRLIEIPNSEFGHGRTRNFAAQQARGKYIAYLTHDATPASAQWLSRLLEPLEQFPNVAGVLGKQIPRAGAFPLLAYDIEAVFASQGVEHAVTISSAPDERAAPFVSLDAVTFYSDVNSATRTEFLTSKIPYRDVLYAEDQLFARDFISAGYSKAYVPLASVFHSNKLSLSEYPARIFDEIVGLRRTGIDIAPLGLWQALRIATKGALSQQRRILRDGRFTWKRKLYWMVLNPVYHYGRWLGHSKGSKVRLDDPKSIEASSLESRKRVG